MSPMFRSALLAPIVLSLFVACASKKPTVVVAVPSHGGDSYRHEVESKDGLPHGAATGWYASGELAYRGEFVDGRRHGNFTYFFRNGNWMRRELYAQGELVFTTTDFQKASEELLKRDAAETIPTRVADADQAEAADEEVPTARPDDLEPWWKDVGELWVAGFPEMVALGNRSGVEARISMHQVKVGDLATETSRRQVSFAQQFSRLGLPEWGLYGSGVFPKVNGNGLQDPFSGRSTLELGGRWMTENRRLAVRVGAMFGAGNDDAEGEDGARFTLPQRVSDTVGSFAGTTALRTQVTYVGHESVINYRVDSGFDVAIAGDEATSSQSVLLGRLDAGVGFATDFFGVAGQLSSALPIAGSNLDPLVTASFSVQLRGDWAWPALSFFMPLTGDDNRVGMSISIARHFSLL